MQLHCVSRWNGYIYIYIYCKKWYTDLTISRVLCSLTFILPFLWMHSLHSFIHTGSHLFALLFEIICDVDTFINYSSTLSVNIQVFWDVRPCHWLNYSWCVEWVLLLPYSEPSITSQYLGLFDNEYEDSRILRTVNNKLLKERASNPSRQRCVNPEIWGASSIFHGVKCSNYSQ